MTARQLAFQLLFLMEARNLSPTEAEALLFEEEHYAELAEEDIIFGELPDQDQMNYIRRIAGKFFEEKKTIDGIISKYSGHWKIERLSKPALAILRCAICEILHVEDVTEGVAVNEAVEMAKRYDSEETSAYVNALLRTWLRDREG